LPGTIQAVEADAPRGPFFFHLRLAGTLTFTMSDQRYPGDIRHNRVPLRVRRAGHNRYRVTDEAGRGVQYRKREDFSADVLTAIDAANGEEVLLEGWLNRSGRWALTGRLVEPTN
jgi:hypothetical protein